MSRHSDSRGYYRTLGLSSAASREEIKSAYRTIAKALHPDVNRGRDTTADFQRVNEAYGVLSNPFEKASYDHACTVKSESSPSESIPTRRSNTIRVEPFTCMDCERASPRLRHIVYTRVVSFVVFFYKTNYSGVFCPDCAKERIVNASLATLVCGWLSVPGLIYSIHALIRNISGGQKNSAVNLEVCARQAIFYYNNGDLAFAREAATDAKRFSTGCLDDAEKRRVMELMPLVEEVLARTVA